MWVPTCFISGEKEKIVRWLIRFYFDIETQLRQQLREAETREKLLLEAHRSMAQYQLHASENKTHELRRQVDQGEKAINSPSRAELLKWEMT